MFKNIKLTALALFTALVAQTAVGQVNRAAHTRSIAGTNCDQVGQCLFTNLNQYNNGSGSAAYFHCVPGENVTQASMTTKNALVTGFQEGQLTLSARDLSVYSFGVYADDRILRSGKVTIVDPQTGNGIGCHAGQNNRPVYPGIPSAH